MNEKKLVAIDTTTGRPARFSAEATRKVEAQLNAHGDLAGLDAFANEAGDVRFAASIVPYWAAKPAADAAFREDYQKRLGAERGER